MKILGLDFDNTLIHYDKIFYKTALEKGLIDKTIPANKKEIRDHLKSRGMEEEFTNMQAEVYGNAINNAKPADGVLKTLGQLKNKNIKLYIISHKTEYPYKGPRYNLRNAAMKWLVDNKFLNETITGMRQSDVFFESSKTQKIERIVRLGCDAYVDDLPEILAMLPKTIQKIYYNPLNKNIIKDCTNMSDWNQLEDMLVI